MIVLTWRWAFFQKGWEVVVEDEGSCVLGVNLIKQGTLNASYSVHNACTVNLIFGARDRMIVYKNHCVEDISDFLNIIKIKKNTYALLGPFSLQP